MDAERRLIQTLASGHGFDHDVDEIEVVETHISWVLLTGSIAYKIKKPVDLGFADFSTLEKRRFFCDEELRLNRRLAPSIYLDAVAISGTPERPVVNGEGPPIEHAVKMRQFARDDELDFVLERGGLTVEHVERLGRVVADFHGRIPVAAADSPFGSPEVTRRDVMENFSQLREVVEDAARLAAIDELEEWSADAHRRLEEEIRRRKGSGFVRECHGDMHLANMVLVDGEITIFDGIDFNEHLRWIDVASEIAFLAMDFMSRGRADLAQRFLNAYLERTGDWSAPRVLGYFVVYRALVRAKVAAIRACQDAAGVGERDTLRSRFDRLVELARQVTQPRRTALVITHGLSGSGKSTISRHLAAARGAIRIASDVERKRIHGLAPDESSESDLDSGIYTAEATHRTYERLAEIARQTLQAGFPVIVDAAFLRRAQRQRFVSLAEQLDVPFEILDVRTPTTELRRRIAQRASARNDPSEADEKVLEHQLERREELSDEEREYVKG